jgi:hypothetical protein
MNQNLKAKLLGFIVSNATAILLVGVARLKKARAALLFWLVLCFSAHLF